MLSVVPYLTFNGTCEAAFTLYAEVLGAPAPQIMRFSDAPAPAEGEEGMNEAYGITPETAHHIMHTELRTDTLHLMGSDGYQGQPTGVQNISLMLNIPTVEEQDRIFAALSANGHVIMPPAETFWGSRFAMFTDQYGVQWQLSVTLKEWGM